MFQLKRLNRPLVEHLFLSLTITSTKHPSGHPNSTPFRNFVKHLPYNRKRPTKPIPKKTEDHPRVYTRDIVSNIYNILKYSSWETARDQLLKLGIKWDSHIVNRVLKTHPPMEKAWLFFNWVSGVKGFKHDHFTYTTMLDIFGEAGRIESMNYVFEKMRERGVRIDAVTYTSLMHWVSRSADVDAAAKAWGEMRRNGCFPTVVSYTAYMKILLDNGRVEEATGVYKEMLESGIQPSCHTYTVFMDYLFVAGKNQQALEIFGEMQEAGVQPDKAACNILVERCCKVGETMGMMKVLQFMKDNYLVLRYPVFLEALKTLKVAGESDAILRQVNPHFATESINNEDAVGTITDNDSLDRGLVLFLLEKKNFVAIDHLISGLKDRNKILDSWVVSIIVEENSNDYRPDGALLAFEYSMKLGIDLERTAYLSLIGVLIKSKTFTRVVDIVEEMTKAGYSLGTYLTALLIYRLGCARMPTCAAKMFNLLPNDQKCTAAYTALIGAYFSVGGAEKALKIYKTMKKKNIRPCLGTYSVILGGLERSGRVSETDSYRKEKKSLLMGGHCQNTASWGEKVCDLLFAGEMLVNQ